MRSARRNRGESTMHNDNTERLQSLDAVRAGALLLGIVLHGAMSYMPVMATMGWPIIDNSPSDTLQTLFFVIHIFRMTAFFVIAGFFAHLLFHRRGASGFIKDRSKRVLIPLVVGWLVLMPAVSAIFVWSLLRAGLPLEPPKRPDLLLPVPLMHLWFLYVLALLYVAVLATRALALKLFDGIAIRARVDASVGWLMRSHLAPLLLGLPVALCLAMRPGWGVYEGIPTPDQSLIPNLPAIVGYGVAFTIGWLLHRQQNLLSIVQRAWASYVIAAVLASIAIVALGVMKLPLITGALAYGIASWVWTFALI